MKVARLPESAGLLPEEKDVHFLAGRPQLSIGQEGTKNVEAKMWDQSKMQPKVVLNYRVIMISVKTQNALWLPTNKDVLVTLHKYPARRDNRWFTFYKRILSMHDASKD